LKIEGFLCSVILHRVKQILRILMKIKFDEIFYNKKDIYITFKNVKVKFLKVIFNPGKLLFFLLYYKPTQVNW